MQLSMIMLRDGDEKNCKAAREALKQIGMDFPQSVRDHGLQGIFETISEAEDTSETSALYLAVTTISVSDILFRFTISLLTEKVIKGKRYFLMYSYG